MVLLDQVADVQCKRGPKDDIPARPPWSGQPPSSRARGAPPEAERGRPRNGYPPSQSHQLCEGARPAAVSRCRLGLCLRSHARTSRWASPLKSRTPALPGLALGTHQYVARPLNH